MNHLKSPLLWFALILVGIGLIAALAPAERSLGVNVRVVYLHGAWVWTAMAAFLAAAITGAAGLLTQRPTLQLWSRALGRTGLVFWITYLPISLWAMQTNWNGLFLAEPRWRLAVVFAVGGLILQVGVSLLENPAWACLGNIIYFLLLLLALGQTGRVLHPPSPILTSDSLRIQLFFAGLLALILLAAWQVARLWHRLELKRSRA